MVFVVGLIWEDFEGIEGSFFLFGEQFLYIVDLGSVKQWLFRSICQSFELLEILVVKDSIIGGLLQFCFFVGVFNFGMEDIFDFVMGINWVLEEVFGEVSEIFVF